MSLYDSTMPERLADARGTANLDGKHYLFEFDSLDGGPVKIRLASASGWDGGGREFAGRDGEREIDGNNALVIVGDYLRQAVILCNHDAHAEITLIRITEQPDGVVLFEREDSND